MSPELKNALKEVEMELANHPTETDELTDAIMGAFLALMYLVTIPNPRVDE
jgi:hypothetical protein